MIVSFSEKAWEDYLYWLGRDRAMLRRINTLIKDIKRNPHDKTGIGKPEALKGTLQGYCSRRINNEHRLIYKTADQDLIIAQCRYY
jgi:toxin YoeB